MHHAWWRDFQKNIKSPRSGSENSPSAQLDKLGPDLRDVCHSYSEDTTWLRHWILCLNTVGQHCHHPEYLLRPCREVLLHTGGGAQSFLAAALPMAQLTSLLPGTDVCAHPFLDEFQGPPVLRDLEQLHGTPLILGQPLTARIMSRTNSVLQGLEICEE
ncbi:uncharacterized protein AAES06_008591 isoform 2-T3 [Glossophaga mutica]